MLDDTDTSDNNGSADADTQDDQGSQSDDQGSQSVGLDTPLDPAVMGGKYKTVGDLVNAAKDKQKEAQGYKPADPKPNDEDDQPVTQKQLKVLEAQRAEQAKFDNVTSKLGIKGARKDALAAYGESNPDKSWQDIAVELGFTDSDRVASALGQSSDERGGNMPGRKVSSIGDATTVEEVDEAIDNMSDEEFIKETDALAGKNGEKKFEY